MKLDWEIVLSVGRHDRYPVGRQGVAHHVHRRRHTPAGDLVERVVGVIGQAKIGPVLVPASLSLSGRNWGRS